MKLLILKKSYREGTMFLSLFYLGNDKGVLIIRVNLLINIAKRELVNPTLFSFVIVLTQSMDEYIFVLNNYLIIHRPLKKIPLMLNNDRIYQLRYRQRRLFEWF